VRVREGPQRGLRRSGREAPRLLKPVSAGSTRVAPLGRRIPALVLGLGIASTLLAPPCVGQLRRIAVGDLEPRRQLPFAIDTLWLLGGDDNLGGAGFGSVSAVALDSSRRILVADMRMQRVHVLDTTGRIAGSVGRAGDGPGEFRLPTRIAVAPDGHVFVFDQYASRVTEFDGDHSLLRAFVLEKPVSARTFLVTDEEILISGVESGDRVIHAFSKNDGRHRSSFGVLRAIRSPELAREAGAGPMVLAPDGSVWYAAPGPYSIEQYSRNGEFRLVVERANRFLPPAEDGVTVRPDGNRLVFGHRPRATVARISFTRDGRLWHQVVLPDRQVVTDEFEVTGTSQGGARLLRSWVGPMPVLGPEVRPDVFVIITRGPRYDGPGIAMVRLRPLSR
jgi:hypothetical protein